MRPERLRRIREQDRLRRERKTDEERQTRLVNTKFDQHKVKPDFVFLDIDYLGAEKLKLQHLTHPSPRSQPCRHMLNTILSSNYHATKQLPKFYRNLVGIGS